MKKLILLLLLYSSVHADWKDVTWTTPITISSLPYTCSSSGNTDSLRLYVLSGNLSAAGAGITVNADYIKIAGSADTITFDADSAGGVIGLSFSGGADHVFIESLTVLQYRTVAPVANGSYGGSNATGINGGPGAEWIYLKDCNNHATGHSSVGVEFSGGGSGHLAVEIHGGNYTTFVNSFDSRQANDAAAIRLGSFRASPDTFHYYVHEVTLDSGCHAGILVGGIAWVDSNTVTIDAHNEKAATSWANAHGIADNGSAWASSHFNYNTIRSGTDHYGGRGMYFNFGAGTVDSTIEMAYNDIRVSEGDGLEPGAGRGLRVRWGCFYLRVHDNYIEVSADDSGATDYRNDLAHGIWFGAIGEEGSDTSANNWFYNNEIHADWLGIGTPGPIVTCFIWGQIGDFALRGNKMYNNHFYSNVRCIQLSEDAHPAQGLMSYRDTIEWENPQWTGFWGFKGWLAVGAGGAICTANVVLDPILVNTVYDSVANRSAGGTDKEIYEMRTIKIVVDDSTLKVQQNAIVEIVNGYNVEVVDKMTDANGFVYDTLPFLYHHWNALTKDIDSTSFNDYIITAFKGSDTVIDTMTLNATTMEGQDFVVAITLGTERMVKIRGGTFRGNVKIR